MTTDAPMSGHKLGCACPKCHPENYPTVADMERALAHALPLPHRADADKAPMTDAELAARLFHETYERLAPEYGYETRADTKAFDPNSPNGRLMIAVCGHVEAKLLAEVQRLRRERVAVMASMKRLIDDRDAVQASLALYEPPEPRDETLVCSACGEENCSSLNRGLAHGPFELIPKWIRDAAQKLMEGGK